MAHRGGDRRRGRLDATAVLSGRASATIAELLELIHAVNPTARGLTPSEQARRYAQKARLQSVLVRRLGDALRVERDPADPRLVSLRHGDLGRDACHAALAALDDDARAWVQRRLDEAAQDDGETRGESGSGPAPTKTPTPTQADQAAAPRADADTVGDPDELLRLGTEALEAYDYEGAGKLFGRALERSLGGADAARWMLTLLVDHLAADQEALDLRGRLSREAAQTPEVRELLALAAARRGERTTARALLASSDGTRAPDVLAALAAAALAEADPDDAERCAQEVRRRDPAHPALQQIEGEIERAQREARRPAEEELARALAGEDLDEARRIAEAILGRWPRDGAAGRALRTITQRRATRDRERLVAEADEASSRGELETARARLRAALALTGHGQPHEDVARRLAWVDAEMAERAVQSRVAEVCSRFARDDLVAALSAYASLEDEPRRRVRAHVSHPALERIERLLQGRTAVAAAVDAAIALGDALSLVDGDPGAALAKLEAHARALEGIPEAARTGASARQAVAEQRRRAAEERVGAARASLDRGAAAAALEALASIDRRDARDELREVIEALRASAQASLEHQRREESFDGLRRDGDPFATLALAQSLRASAEGPERARWQRACDELAVEIRRAMQVWLSSTAEDDDGADAAPLPRERPEAGANLAAQGSTPPPAPIDIDVGPSVRAHGPQEDPLPWIDPTGRSMVLAECADRWVFVRMVDLVRRRVRARIVLRTPEPMGWLDAAMSREGAVRLMGDGGAVLELAPDTGDVLFWRAERDVRPSAEIVDAAALAGEGRFVWMTTRSRGPEQHVRVRVVDLERRRLARDLPEGWWFQPVLGLSEPTVACAFRANVLSLHTPWGAARGKTIALDGEVDSVVAHPSGRGLLVLVRQAEDACDGDPALGWVEIDEEGRSSPTRWLPDTWAEGPHACATSLEEGLTFLALDQPERRTELVALRPMDGGLGRAWSVEVPGPVALVGDPLARRVVALLVRHERATLLPLGPVAPCVPDQGPARAGGARLTVFLQGCGRRGATTSPIWPLAQIYERGSEEAFIDELRHRTEAGTDDLRILLDMWDAASLVPRPRLAAEIVGWLQERHPQDPHTALAVSTDLADAGRWREVRERLAGVDLAALAPERQQHGYHLLGLALLYMGDAEGAHRVLQEGSRCTEGTCELDRLIEFAAPLPEDTPSGHQAEESTTIELRRRVRAADIALHREDVEAALQAIDAEVVWASGEVQSLARLAEAHLRVPPRDDAGRYHEALALARFLETHRATTFRHELPFPEAIWPAERIGDVAARAQAWLDGFWEAG
jgi:hypothetical protein